MGNSFYDDQVANPMNWTAGMAMAGAHDRIEYGNSDMPFMPITLQPPPVMFRQQNMNYNW